MRESHDTPIQAICDCATVLLHRLSRMLPSGFEVQLSISGGETRAGPSPGGIRRRVRRQYRTLLDEPPPRLPATQGRSRRYFPNTHSIFGYRTSWSPTKIVLRLYLNAPRALYKQPRPLQTKGGERSAEE